MFMLFDYFAHWVTILPAPLDCCFWSLIQSDQACFVQFSGVDVGVFFSGLNILPVPLYSVFGFCEASGL